MSALQIILIIYGIIGFVLLWILSGHGVAYMSGWKRLAGKFQAPHPYSGTKIFIWHAVMNALSRYDNVLYIGVDAEGLHLRTSILLRIGHRPLLIPWNEISIEPESRVLFFIPVTVLLLGREAQIPCRIWGWKARDLLETSGATKQAVP